MLHSTIIAIINEVRIDWHTHFISWLGLPDYEYFNRNHVRTTSLLLCTRNLKIEYVLYRTCFNNTKKRNSSIPVIISLPQVDYFVISNRIICNSEVKPITSKTTQKTWNYANVLQSPTKTAPPHYYSTSQLQLKKAQIKPIYMEQSAHIKAFH